jgi:membrane-associated phospholipid phosphatase
MWDRRVVEKLMSVWGSLLLHVHSKMLKIISPGLLRVFMALILMGIEGFFGMNWLVCLVGGTCLGALGVILTSLVSLVRDREKPVFSPTMVEFSKKIDFIFDQGLMDLPLVGGTFTW